MARKTIAQEWIEENREVSRSGSKIDWRQRKLPKTDLAKHLRNKAREDFTIKGFVEHHRSHRSAECLFVPGAITGRPSRVTYLGKGMTASRYMTLLTHGTPKNAGAVSRHLCGNGHLSCVNPEHLVWGSEADNRADAAKHQHAKTPQEKIYSTSGRL